MEHQPINILIAARTADEASLVEQLLRNGRPGHYVCERVPWEEVLARDPQSNRVDAIIRVCNAADLRGGVQHQPGPDGRAATPVFLVVTDDPEELPSELSAQYASVPLLKSELSASLLDRVIRFGVEEKLRRRETRFKSLIENSRDIITVLDEKGVIRFASPSVRQVLGYESDALSGTPVLALIHSDDAARTAELFKESIQEGDSVVSTEFRVRHADGSWRTLEANGQRMPTDAGGLLIVVNSRDITLRRQTERDLKRSQELLRVVINSAPIMLLAVDRDGKITLAEGMGLTTVSSLPDRVVGASVFDVFGNSPALLHDVRRALRGDAFHSVIQLGSAIFECWFSPMTTENGQLEGMLGVATDITDLKHSEDDLKLSRSQLRNLARHLQSIREEERARIAREIHDVLGQAMTVLKMDVMWLSQRITDEAFAEKIEGMREVIASTIQTIRKIATELRPGVLDDLGLAAAIEWQAHEFENRTDIRCNVQPIDPEMEVDPQRAISLFRIFQELLTNVARHANARRIDVSLKNTGSSILLTVADDGRGIRPQEISNTKSLGLLGMRERALAWGGTVQFAGSSGEGTTVTVQIPTLLTEEREALP